MTSLARWWPLFGLRIETPRLVLRAPTDDDMEELLDVARSGIHDPSTMPFVVPWTDLPSPVMEQEAMKYWWRCRSEWSADSWSLELCVFLDRRPVGMQSLRASSFRALRSGGTGSWLGRAWQGQGIGTEMRGAMLHLAFEHLAMGEVTSGAMHDNPASARVSIKAGYEPNGRGLVLRRGEATEQQRFRITRERWASLPHSPVTVHGFEACRPMFGL